VDLLISVCGFAATPTLLTYELLRPRRLLVLRSQDATDSVNLIGRYLVGGGRLDFEAFQHETVDSSDPLDMYAKIAKWLGGRDGRFAVIDITGGRKVMSAAAALAAWQLDLGLTYVENQFDPETRQPLPGQDRLVMLDNPTTLFGEQEMARALETFRSGAFEAAHGRYADICDFAALLFYRTIEACLTGRLRRQFPGLDPEDCDYSLIDDLAPLRARYAATGRLLDPPAQSGLPNRLTLFAAALLLAAIGDDLARRTGLVDPTGATDGARLTRLRDRTRARNRSVLAHGTETISDGHTESLRSEARELLGGYWALHGDSADLDELWRRASLSAD
jgi:hypothetical protein